jgi:trk system potassium uptake protein TrkA
VFARVNHPQNEWLFDREWGVDVAVSSSAIMRGLIEKQMGLGDLATLLKLQSDGVSVEELTLPADATSLNRKLADISLPANVTVMAILAKEGYVQAARGNTVLVAGDQLLLLVEGTLEECAIHDAFGIS